MNIIEYSVGEQRKAEVYVTRLLRYFLDPEEPHGMGTEFLSAFLDHLPAECDFQEDTYDLSDVKVETQVKISDAKDSGRDNVSTRVGYADLVLEVQDEWFLVIELKFAAGENKYDGDGRAQTEFYYDAPWIGNQRKTEYDSGKYYLYLHQTNKPEAVEGSFANLTWEELTTDLMEDFLATNGPRLPQRTVRQLREVVDDIKGISGMSNQQENRQEKVELYLEHYEAITEVSEAFDSRWDEFTEEWWSRLLQTIDTEEIKSTWDSTEGTDDWAYLFKHGWWRNQDTLDPIQGDDEDETVRIGFLHRLDHHRELAVGERTLKFQFRNCPPNRHLTNEQTTFRDAFYENFEGRRREIRDALPDAAELTGNMHNQIEVTYDIPVDTHDDFFEAYVAALRQAFIEHAIENEELISEIDSIHQESLENFE